MFIILTDAFLICQKMTDEFVNGNFKSTFSWGVNNFLFIHVHSTLTQEPELIPKQLMKSDQQGNNL